MKGSKSRVSILIPCYNGEHYIDRAFASILNQTESNLEIIFVDDGSTDSSLQLAAGYRQKFTDKGHRLITLHKSNGGAASAVKEALSASTGKYIIPLDIDDELLSDSCKLQADFLDHNPQYGLVLTNGYIVSHNGEKRMLREHDLTGRDIFRGLLQGTVNNVPGVYMINGPFLRDYYKEHEFLITNYGQNLQLLLPSSYSFDAGYINRPLLNYNVHIGSHSRPDNYERECNNLRGYYDVRLSMLRIMELATNQNLELAKEAYLSASLFVEGKYRKTKEYNTTFSELKKYRKPTFQELVDFYILNKSPYQYPLRVLLKLKNYFSNA